MSGKVVLGLGGTVDFEIFWDPEIFQRLVSEYEICLEDVQGNLATEAQSMREILVTILRSMFHGKGTECHVSQSRFLLQLARYFTYTTTLGGTCVRAAICLDKVSIPSLVHLVSISEEVRALLPESVEWICSVERDTLDPHVIVQYEGDFVVQLSDGSFTDRKSVV